MGLVALCIFLIASCDASTSHGSSSTHSLAIDITALPADNEAIVNVTGPVGYRATLSMSGVLRDLSIGEYRITAASVDVDGQRYLPRLATDAVVVGLDTPQPIEVRYRQLSGASGSISIDAALPGGMTPHLTIEDSEGFVQRIGSGASLRELVPDTYVIRMQPITASDGSVYVPDVPSATVHVQEASPTVVSMGFTRSSPSKASLLVSIVGLPEGTLAAVDIVGPQGFEASLTESATLTDLARGRYTATANDVLVGDTPFTVEAGGVSVRLSNGNPGMLELVYASTVSVTDPSPDPSPEPEPDPDPDPDPPSVSPPTNPTTTLQPTLLQGYWQIERVNGVNEEQTRFMRYRPRQFDSGLDLFDLSAPNAYIVTDPGAYRSWDVLSTREHRHASVNYPAMDYVLLRLSRQARVGVIWYSSSTSLPSWLHAWERGSDVVINGVTRRVFLRDFEAGDHYLGTPEGRNVQMYSVILAEAGGRASEPPAWPSEWGPPIAPNLPIPRDHVLHNIHFADGPDGKSYPTYHPQIDPVTWAYYEHEHGSDPSTFAGFPAVQPVWAYTDPTVLDDGFFGFKTVTLEAIGDDGRSYSFLFTFHLESLTRERLCKRHHTMDLAIADSLTGEVLARLHLLADTGFAQGVGADGTTRRIRPAACPEVADIRSDGGRRNINTSSSGAYEAWQYDLGVATALPFLGGVSFMMESFMTFIGTETNSAGEYTAQYLHDRNDSRMGSSRHLQFAGQFFGIDARDGSWGHFCTDRYGTQRVACGNDTVRQYVKPGVRIAIPKGDQPRYGVRDPWTSVYVPQPEVGAIINVWRNLEHAIVFDRGKN